MPHLTYTMGELLTEIPGVPNLEELLADVAWLNQVGMGDRLVIRAIIKPDLSLKTPLELLAQLTAGYVKVVEILENTGMDFWSLPKLTIEGKAHGSSRNQCMHGGLYDDRGFHEIRAEVRIELKVPR